MLSFIKVLSETEESISDIEFIEELRKILPKHKTIETLLKKIGDIFPKQRHFNVINIDDYQLSIQASYYHYCKPKRTLNSLEDYSAMEIVIAKNKIPIQPRDDEFIRRFQRYNELIEKYEEGLYSSGNYMPIDLIEDLYRYLSNQ